MEIEKPKLGELGPWWEKIDKLFDAYIDLLKRVEQLEKEHQAVRTELWPTLFGKEPTIFDVLDGN